MIDLRWVAANRRAIWRAAAIAESAGEPSWLSPEWQAVSDAANQAMHVAETAWDAPIASWAADQIPGMPFTVAQVLIGSKVRNEGGIQPQDYGRVAQILKSLGWERYPAKNRKAWMRPIT
jgi:predicted P-loop ATPase